MVDDDSDSKSRRHRLLSRSRWVRGKSDDKDVQAKEIVDFLKPSTEKAAAFLPKINVAVAQRFPAASGLAPQVPEREHVFTGKEDVNGLRKRRRREGLRVTFAMGQPDIMGEGGDDSPYPTIELPRTRTRGENADTRPVLSPASDEAYERHTDGYSLATNAGAEQGLLENVRSPSQSRHEHPLHGQRENLPAQSDLLLPNANYLTDSAVPVRSQVRVGNMSPSIASHKGRAMRVNEGMALRRGSAYMDDSDDEDDEENNENNDNDPPPHFQPHSNPLASSLRALAYPRKPLAPKVPQHARSHSSEIRPANTPSDVHLAQPYNARQGETQSRPIIKPSVSDVLPLAPANQSAYPGKAQYRAYEPQQSQQRTAINGQQGFLPIPRNSDAVAGASSEALHKALSTSEIRPRGSRPTSMDSPTSMTRSVDSIQPSRNHSSAGEAAFLDFAARVAHMKGVFNLTAERERPAEQCAPDSWLRTACWWFIEGKIELERALRRRARSPQPFDRELLLQGHVDLAKTWWILTGPLERSRQQRDSALHKECDILQDHLNELCLSIGRSKIMPPHASLIQGQDTRVWLEYPSLHPSTVTILNGISNDVTSNNSQLRLPATHVLPMSDTAQIFCYNRFRVHVVVGSYEPDAAQQSLTCMLSVVRDTRTFQNSIIIASQNDLVTLIIGSGSGTIDWRSIEWHIKGNVLSYRPNRDLSISIYLQEEDFRLLRSMLDYTRKAIDMLNPEAGENSTFKTQVLSARYSDSAKSRIFPRDRVRDCQVCVFEQHATPSSKVNSRSRRLAIVTSPSTKILSCVTHQLHHNVPLQFETLTRQDGSIAPALRLSLHDDGRQADVQLEFPDMRSMHDFCAAIAGCQPGTEEIVTDELDLASVAIETLTDYMNPARSKPDPLKLLEWRKACIISSREANGQQSFEHPGQPASLRLSLEHAGGFMLDTLSVNGQSLRLRLLPNERWTMEVLRTPEIGFAATLDIRLVHPGIRDAAIQLVQDIHSQATLRTFKFSQAEHLYRFQSAITGYTIMYTGTASSFIISRRKMAVPVKYGTTDARVQVAKNLETSSLKILAFMTDFELTEAMCFEIKPTNTFEQIKGDGKGKKWAVKVVDAEFSLGSKAAIEENDAYHKLMNRFVDPVAPGLGGEHGDITIGFDSESDRDLFSQVLPAKPTTSRLMTLRKRQ